MDQKPTLDYRQPTKRPVDKEVLVLIFNLVLVFLACLAFIFYVAAQISSRL